MDNDHPLFDNNSIRRFWHKNEWWFVIEDVVLTLISSLNVKNYIDEIKLRDEGLSQWWAVFVYSFDMETENGKKKMDCANIEGVFRIIQSVVSPQAEPFKRWMAKLGRIRIVEVSRPD